MEMEDAPLTGGMQARPNHRRRWQLAASVLGVCALGLVIGVASTAAQLSEARENLASVQRSLASLRVGSLAAVDAVSPHLMSTGIDAHNNELKGGAVDPHWYLVPAPAAPTPAPAPAEQPQQQPQQQQPATPAPAPVQEQAPTPAPSSSSPAPSPAPAPADDPFAGMPEAPRAYATATPLDAVGGDVHAVKKCATRREKWGYPAGHAQWLCFDTTGAHTVATKFHLESVKGTELALTFLVDGTLQGVKVNGKALGGCGAVADKMALETCVLSAASGLKAGPNTLQVTVARPDDSPAVAVFANRILPMAKAEAPAMPMGTGLTKAGKAVQVGKPDPHWYEMVSGSALKVADDQVGFHYVVDGAERWVVPNPATGVADPGLAGSAATWTVGTLFHTNSQASHVTLAIEGYSNIEHVFCNYRLVPHCTGATAGGLQNSGGCTFAIADSCGPQHFGATDVNQLMVTYKHEPLGRAVASGILVQVLEQKYAASERLFSTGIDASGATLAAHAADPHWYVEDDGTGAKAHAASLLDNALSAEHAHIEGAAWIGQPNGGKKDQLYVYSTAFDAPSAQCVYEVELAADNKIAFLELNAHRIGAKVTKKNVLKPITLSIDSGLKQGTNTLKVHWANHYDAKVDDATGGFVMKVVSTLCPN
mmetsp:Transcript_25518/g.84042  ORF Transcript_25518/g.84042 Transcript_25518/m.84042 type:complete len:651 (-) Transcript_25518:115-2067(-)|eukprot:CAMPEP_0170133342 /NCGR_PEP_ID=MMETSP0033_2-20121228/1231_1 /TAXON_ID=195969 /ORGANISM="Dolichomastix tenuilepis, Strain CCMP3274" /LENGTH=650 /DNA_ID=CAMNT_0010368819 /DNA_START=15 /DNA_END=1967 /DNA_ORIENTATION=-